MIRHRSGKDFDSIAGPIIVCVGLLVALILNFVFKVSDHFPTTLVRNTNQTTVSRHCQQARRTVLHLHPSQWDFAPDS